MVVHTCNTSPKDRSLCDLASLVCMAKLDFKEADTKLKGEGQLSNLKQAHRCSFGSTLEIISDADTGAQGRPAA